MRRLVRLLPLTAIAALLALTQVTTVSAAAVPLVTEGFHNGTVSGPWSALGSACLTASQNTSQTPIPGCPTGEWGLPPTGDAAGSGALRLTDNVNSEGGGVVYTTPIPSADGLTVRFTQYQYGNGADGMTFFLASAVPGQLGSLGSGLGYGPYVPSSQNGLPNAYLGVGLDAYGGYNDTGVDGTGCTQPPSEGFAPNTVDVRGAGNGTAGYCLLSTSADLSPNSLQGPGPTRGTGVPVEITIDGVAKTYTVALDFGSGFSTVTSGPLPSGTPASWYFGFTGATGGISDVHELSDLSVSTLTSPALSLNVTDSAGGSFTPGASASYTVTAGVASSGTAEAAPITVTDTVPSQMTVGTPTGTGWSCSVSGQKVTCTYTSLTPIAPGTTLPAITIPVTVAAGASGAVTDTATASSVDAATVNASDPGTIAAVPVPSTGAGLVLWPAVILLGLGALLLAIRRRA